uniref:Cadherin N-terminal domain-containing protein n=1 Tax=Denticeps clupeoides TaxID=299321 RepID=A0AAY4DL59_9TELE
MPLAICGKMRETWRLPRRWIVFVSVWLFCRGSFAQIRYSVYEEQKDGSVVGNVAKDLGIDVRVMKQRGFRIVSTSKYFAVSTETARATRTSARIR